MIEDQLVVDNLDIVAVTGGSLRAHVITTLPVLVTDGILTITMTASIGQVMISGIEVMAAANIVTHRINSGTTAATTIVRMNYVDWTRDLFSLSGATSNRCTQAGITNSIYCSSRYFRTSIGTPLRYNIPLPSNNALYTIRLHFNEHVRRVIHFVVAVFLMPKVPMLSLLFSYSHFSHDAPILLFIVVLYCHWYTSV